MYQSLMLLLAAVAVCVSQPTQAAPATDWTQIETVVIDPRAAGTKVIELPFVAISELRFTADKPITIASAKTLVGTVSRAAVSSIALLPGTPSASFFTSKEGVIPKQVEISWIADTKATGTVKIEIWGLTGSKRTQSAAADAEKANKSARAASEQPAAAAPPPTKRGISPGSGADSGQGRSIGSAQPPSAPRPSAAAPPPPPVAQPAPEAAAPPPAARSAGAQAKPNACADANTCTIVDVYFGTDRKAVDGPERKGFGSDRAYALTLGRAFVTVPKVRPTGSIPLPSTWDRYVRGVPVAGDPARHFTIPRDGVEIYADEAAFLAAAKKHIANAGDFKDHAFIFVHGFYVSFDDALYRTAQISYDLAPDGRPFGTAFMYSWPSLGDPRAYLYDGDSARGAATHLQSFIRTVVDKTGVANVHIIAHSMGNVALIDALKQLATEPTKAKINQVILAAPDYDKQLFESTAAGVSRLAKGVTLYASQRDYALRLSRNAYSGAPRAGESVVPPGPAIVPGIYTVDISAISSAAFWGHDIYADSPELLSDIRTIFTKQNHPPSDRSNRFQLLSKGALQYWRYADRP